ncbi:alpha-N-acetylgalactosaminide alpha-2,6-sialyltransferase 6-like [Scyliorhinus torazame]|uniref:alpha-N-acetylgalactosaminide alpha-2,6-sialyltransferase 6-like n=1 Tax=Scyliorhinus torazame TaxID=75743 RepID=UPI003B5B53A0
MTCRLTLDFAMRGDERVESYVVATAIFVLTTLLIIYSSSSGNDSLHYKGEFISHAVSRTPINVKKWATKDGYFPVIGNKPSRSSNHPGQSSPIATFSTNIHSLHQRRTVAATCAVCKMHRRTAPRLLRQRCKPRTATSWFFWGPPQKMLKNSRGNVYRLIHQAGLAFSSMTAFVIAPKRMQQFDDLFQRETGRDRKKSHSWLSTGWFTMVIAIELCDHVQVYGMAPPNHCRVAAPKHVPYHYYEPKGPDECKTFVGNERAKKGNHHRFITEKDVFAEWAKLYNVSFLHPSW